MSTITYAWVTERYEPRIVDQVPLGMACKRCGDLVWWLTKHAAVKHGDDVVVVFPTRDNTDPIRMAMW